MAGRPRYDWPAPEEVRRVIETSKTEDEAAERLSVTRSALQHFRRKHKIPLPPPKDAVVDAGLPDDTFAEAVHRRLKRKEYSVEDLADDLDCAPRKVRDAIERLRAGGYRIPDEGPKVRLEKVAPTKTKVHKALFEGEEVTVGIVSDTHLCSNEQALAELELAYDTFADEGIQEVWHSGDIVDGLGIYRGQNAEVIGHTLDEQVDYAAENYPQREGITTRLIGGNHDLEGDAGRVGLDLARAISNRRDDLDYLGPWSAYIELHGGATVHLLHGKGGMSYAYSYKAQKLTEGYAPGRKPSVLIPGHWHVRGDFQARGIQVVFPGCTQWRSTFMERLGLTPAVGFHILRMTLGDDGSVVQWAPRWYPIWEGRHVE